MSEPASAPRFPVDPELGLHEPEAHPSYGEIVAFFGHVAYLIPPLRGVLAEHLRDSEGEVLPTLLMDDILTWVLDELRQGPSMLSIRLFSTMDAAYGEASNELRMVFVIGFLEHIPGYAGLTPDPEGLGMRVRNGLGPTMTAVLEIVEEQRRSQG